MVIKVEDYIFDIDKEKTNEFYKNKEICFNDNNKIEKLTQFLKRFNIDIQKPLKASNDELYFKVYGKVLKYDKYEIEIYCKNNFFSIMVTDDKENNLIYFDIFGDFNL